MLIILGIIWFLIFLKLPPKWQIFFTLVDYFTPDLVPFVDEVFKTYIAVANYSKYYSTLHNATKIAGITKKVNDFID